MVQAKKKLIVLMAEDDDDYYLLAKQAFEESCPQHRLYRVEDGEELMNYLRFQGKYAAAVRPHVILLDLNMPRKSGRQALQEMKADPNLKRIPVVIFTTSKAEQDIQESYRQGAHSYIWKPVAFKQLLEMLKVFCRYWFDTIELPPHR